MGSREKESQAGGREMGDSESSIGGDTVSGELGGLGRTLMLGLS